MPTAKKKKSVMKAGKKPLRCPTCRRTFETQRGYRQHLRLTHYARPKAQPVEWRPGGRPEWRSSSKSPIKKTTVMKAGKKPPTVPTIDWKAVWEPLKGLRRIYPYPVMWTKMRAKIRTAVEGQLKAK